MELEGIVKFVNFIHQFQEIERVMKIRGRESPENDVEHSYQLAMVSWYAISAYNLKLDVNKALKYALVHDLVEVYAGDVDAFDPDPKRDEKKKEKEHHAWLKMKEEFTEFPEMIELIAQYESQKDAESKFVYALDKVIAPINIYLDNGRTWQERGIDFTMEKLISNKRLKIAGQPDVEKLFEELVSVLEKNPHLFSSGAESK